jgi:diguanylate cyclase (GGDEF)-like protein
VLVPDVAGPGAVTLAGRIRAAVAREPFVIDGIEIPVTTSAGVAARIDEGPEDVDRLVNRADEALYKAKRRGRDRVASVALGTRSA